MKNSIKELLKKPLSVGLAVALGFGMTVPVYAAGSLAPMGVESAVAAGADQVISGDEYRDLAAKKSNEEFAAFLTAHKDDGVCLFCTDGDDFAFSPNDMREPATTNIEHMISLLETTTGDWPDLLWWGGMGARVNDALCVNAVLSSIDSAVPGTAFYNWLTDAAEPTSLKLVTPGSELAVQADDEITSIDSAEFAAAADARTNDDFLAFLAAHENDENCVFCGSEAAGNGLCGVSDSFKSNLDAWISNDGNHWSDFSTGGSTPPCWPFVYTSLGEHVDELYGFNTAFIKWVLGKEAPAGVSYTAIKVFDADVTGDHDADEAPKASNIEYADGVEAVFQLNGVELLLSGIHLECDYHHDFWNNGYNAWEYNEGAMCPNCGRGQLQYMNNEYEIIEDFPSYNPQIAAEQIAANIQHQPGEDLAAGSYGIDLAKKLMANGANTTKVIADADGFVTLDGSGYYLIVRTDALTGENTAATSPIFAALGAGENTISLKSAIPSLTKQLKEDADNNWTTEADHALNDVVDYRLIGTVAGNIVSYDTYSFKFSDSYDADALTIDGDIAVWLDGHNVTDQVNVNRDDEAGTFVVETGNIKALTYVNDDEETVAIPVNADSKVVVTYSAHQSGVTASPDGVENTAYLEYSNNPMVEDSFGTTPTVSTKDYSYALRIYKTDNATGIGLSGVKFSVKDKETGNYLMIEDGKLVERALAEGEDIPTFTTGFDPITGEELADTGMILLNGVDGDDYIIVERETKDSYVKLAEDEFITVTPNKDDRENVSALVSSTTNLVSGADSDDAIVQVNVKNIKQIQLPSTGEAGIALLALIAGAFAVRAVINRRKSNDYKVMNID